MKHFLILALFSLGSWSNSIAQNVSYDAVQLSNVLIEKSWKATEVAIPTLLLGVKAQLEKGGATKESSRVLVEELQKSFTKENFGRGFAKVLSEKFSAEELRQISEFLASPVGKKYFELFGSEEQGLKVIEFILKSACDASKEKLSFFDRGSINSVCRGF